MLVGAFGPYTVQQFLLEGTPLANSYVGIVQGLFTAIVVVMSINQLILQGKFGPLSHQRERLEAVLSHRREVEDRAGVDSSPTDPTGFVRTAVDATQEQLIALDEAMAEHEDPELRERVETFVERVRREIAPVDAALETTKFQQVEFLGAVVHWDVARDVHRVDVLERTYAEELDDDQRRAFEDVLDALKLYDITREYFRVQFLHLQFVRFTRGMLLTGLPALLVAHYATGALTPGVLPGSTAGIPNLLWLESGLFAFTMLPALVIASFVARIAMLSLTSVFPGPFSVDASD